MSSSSEGRCVIFLHVPKTGGRTLQTIAARQYENVWEITGSSAELRRNYEEFCSSASHLLRRNTLVRGHFPFGLHRHCDYPTTYITVLRDPVDRVISHYYYVLRQPDHYLHKQVMSQNISLQEYATGKLAGELKNGQVKQVAGFWDFKTASSDVLERAKENLTKHFGVVGLTRKFDESLLLIKHELGWGNVCYQRRNVSKNRPTKSGIPLEIREEIRAQNKWDIELYEYAEHLLNNRMAMDLFLPMQVQYFKLWNKVASQNNGSLRLLIRTIGLFGSFGKRALNAIGPNQ